MPYRIYLITNQVNRKTYVGKTKFTIQKRWQDHLKTSTCVRLHRPILDAIRKYGQEVFTISQIDSCDDPKLINWLESFYIGLTRSHVSEGGYNLTAGGEGLHHFSHSPETRKKMSISQLGNKHCLGHQNTLGYRHTPEAKVKIAAAGTGRIFSQERRDKIGKAHKGLKPSAAHLQKLKDLFTGKPAPWNSYKRSEEVCQKMSEAHLGKPAPWASHPRSTEDKIKIAAAVRLSITEEYKEAARKGAAIATHKRWHLARGINNPKCKLCQEAKNG